VTEKTKTQLRQTQARLNPFQLHREIEQQKKQIEAIRRIGA